MANEHLSVFLGMASLTTKEIQALFAKELFKSATKSPPAT